MMRKKPILVLILVILSCAIAVKPDSLGFVTAQQNIQPWTFNIGWEFTWNITVANYPGASFLGKEMLFTVNQIMQIMVNGQVSSYNLQGNLSMYMPNLEFENGNPWNSMKTNFTYVSYNVNTGRYTFSPDAFKDRIFFLPLNLQYPMSIFENALLGVYNDSSWIIASNETDKTYDATNRVNVQQKVHFDFDTNGAIHNETISWPNGSIEYQMILISIYNPNNDLTIIFNVITFTSAGAIIMIVIVYLFHRYKIKIKDVVSGKQPVSRSEDNEQEINENGVNEETRPEKEGR